MMLMEKRKIKSSVWGVAVLILLISAGCSGVAERTSVFKHSYGPKPDVERWELFWASVDDSKSVRLTPPPLDGRSMTWSPNGEKLVFVSNRSGNDEIYTMNLDGSGTER